MLRKSHILPVRFSSKSLLRYGKTLLASNLSLALIALPVGFPSVAKAADVPETSLIISQDQLDLAFNVPTQKVSKETQIPLEFRYMSQGFSVFHPGIDLATNYGTPIKPFKAGIVKEAGFSPFGYGNNVIIEHEGGIESLYAHMSKIKVKIGDEVDIDTEIGLVGLTGHTTGPHLHFEIRRNGRPVNPLTLLPPISQSTGLLSSKITTSNQQ